MRRTPVIFLHGNDDAPYPTGCNRTGVRIDALARYFADHGYASSELWALGYQGTQCDQTTIGWSQSASAARTPGRRK